MRYENDFLKTSHNEIRRKKDKDRKFMKDWRLISFRNVNTKFFSKASVERLENVLPSSISSNQIAHVNDRFNSERACLKPAILEISNSLKMLGLLLQLRIDIDIAFDSLTVLENCSLNQDFLKWICILLQNQKCCVIYGVFWFKKRY